MSKITKDIYTNWRDVMNMPIRAVNTPMNNIVSTKYIDKKPWLLKRSRLLRKKKGHTIRWLHDGANVDGAISFYGGRIDSKGNGSHWMKYKTKALKKQQRKYSEKVC